ncbi:MAG: hypothetical protein C6P37_08460 [Caldibacillus debilis]|uniref:Uncharacterized protein n=1 Tax=Caldibacillus debilis TaxID=301148 RepID=A0A3E0K527_9BACI|nr:MAG: hypothetical protein BAA03_11995 [Caldibacillus debilis]REJ16466.1 MAG: hypothetical protein C6W57_08160 [Caldibacillus debilis]REJ28661.1 MAG: hypothetical protein C6P37_08460 [Caldibacillus debilis]REJ28725.1 MAG: hypothetical protein C6W56_07700 [Caldibacillus debilis]
MFPLAARVRKEIPQGADRQGGGSFPKGGFPFFLFVKFLSRKAAGHPKVFPDSMVKWKRSGGEN